MTQDNLEPISNSLPLPPNPTQVTPLPPKKLAYNDPARWESLERFLYEEAEREVKQLGCEAQWLEYGYDTFKKWDDDYVRAQKDLFWLAKELLGYALVSDDEHQVHERLTKDFFIKKNPYIDAKTWKDAVGKQSTDKNRLLLYPRGSFKSSINQADALQWIICFPNIRILVMTAEESLAVSFAQKIRGYFEVQPDTPLTRFQMLFLAHCFKSKKKEAENQFTSNARTEKQTEPTLLALSLGMNTAGKHFEVGKFDDCVSNINSGPKTTPEQRKSIAQELILARYLIDPSGYKDYIGTPYAEDDAYTHIQNEYTNLRVMRQPAMWVREESRRKRAEELGESDYHLLFPVDGDGVPRLDWAYLSGENTPNNSYLFSCQYLLDPTVQKDAKFTEQMLRSHIVKSESLPKPGCYRVFCAWDLAHSDDKGRDYSVGSVGWFDELGRLFVVEVIRGRFEKSVLADKMAKQCAKWQVEKMSIEKSGSVHFLETDIRNALASHGYPNCPIDWFKVDVNKGAKNSRAESLEIRLSQDTLWFSEDIDILEEIIKEFKNFKPHSKRKDDVVDSIAHLEAQKPPEMEVPATERERQEAVWDLMKHKQLQDLIYGVRENSSQPAMEPIPTKPEEFQGMPIYRTVDEMIYGSV